MTFYQQFKTLTNIDNFDPSKIVFDKPRDEEVGGNKHIKGKRIKIGYLTNGKVTEIIIPTEKLFAYKGVRPTKPFGKEDSDEIIGYNLPIGLYSRDNANGRDRKFVDIFRKIIDVSKDHVISVKKSIGQSHLEKVMLYKWDNMLYEKKDENGDPASEFGPTLFAKLMYSRDKNMLVTKIVDKHGNPLKLDDVLLKPADVIACVKFESIYVNSNGCSLQVKITEAIVDIRLNMNTDNLLLKSFLTPSDDTTDDTELENDMDLLSSNNNNCEGGGGGSTVKETNESDSDIEVEDEGVVVNQEGDEEELVDEIIPEVEDKKPVKKITKKK
jgi:Protein of unknown function (DUF2738)